MRLAIEDLFPGRIALVSSFGADSAVLLHIAAEIDKSLPVVFVDTLHLFPETLVYRDALVPRLGLTHVETRIPSRRLLPKPIPRIFSGRRIRTAAANCAKLRLSPRRSRAMKPGSRAASAFRPRPAPRCRSLRPKAIASKSIRSPAQFRSRIEAYFKEHDLPPHPLVAKGFLSIGCIPCTSPVQPGEEARAGRWRGRGKTECGIHVQTLDAGSDI